MGSAGPITSNILPFALETPFSLIVIGAPHEVDMLQSVSPTKTLRISLLFSGCFIIVFITVPKTH
jgi:hypothetical protein